MFTVTGMSASQKLGYLVEGKEHSYYSSEIFSPTILIFLRNIKGFLALVNPGNIIDAEYNLHLRSAYAH